MTYEEELQHIIDSDPEFTELTALANKNTNTIWHHDAEDIAMIWEKHFTGLAIKEFVAAYKGVLAWSILLGKAVAKKLGKTYSDASLDTHIPGTDLWYRLYNDRAPGHISIFLEKMGAHCTTDITIFKHESLRGYERLIEFKLEHIDLSYSSAAGKWSPKLLESRMLIKIYDPDNPADQAEFRFHVGRFTPDILAIAVNMYIKQRQSTIKTDL